VHVVSSAAGWSKTWTGHYFAGTVSVVRMPDGRMNGMLQQAGSLYYAHPTQSGLWNIDDTRVRVGGAVDATYIDGTAPEAVAIIDDEVQRVRWEGTAWVTVPTGLPASGLLAASYQGGGWPLAMTAEPGMLAVSRVVHRTWSRFEYDVDVPGPIDAVVLPGVGTIIYSVG
jgi:hypothetical protein